MNSMDNILRICRLKKGLKAIYTFEKMVEYRIVFRQFGTGKNEEDMQLLICRHHTV